MATRQDITVDQGEDFSWSFRLYEIINGVKTPINLDGHSFQSFARKTFDQAEKDFEFVCTKRTQTGDNVGVVDMTIEHAITETLTPGPYQYDIEWTNSSGKKKRLTEGQVTVTAEATK